jgi:hypothetical protein
MSIERELLKKILATRWLDHGLSCEVEAILAQPEQTKRSHLTEAEISKTLKLSRRSTEWDYGFEAGVRFAEEFHGIEL